MNSELIYLYINKNIYIHTCTHMCVYVFMYVSHESSKGEGVRKNYLRE